MYCIEYKRFIYFYLGAILYYLQVFYLTFSDTAYIYKQDEITVFLMCFVTY